MAVPYSNFVATRTSESGRSYSENIFNPTLVLRNVASRYPERRVVFNELVSDEGKALTLRIAPARYIISMLVLMDPQMETEGYGYSEKQCSATKELLEKLQIMAGSGELFDFVDGSGGLSIKFRR